MTGTTVFAPTSNAYVAKVDAAGKTLVYCGYVPDGYGADVEMDARGNAYLFGDGQANLPVTRGPGLVYTGTVSDPWEPFVAKVAFTDLQASGSPRIGGTTTLQLNASESPGLPFQLGSSLGTGPIPIDTRQVGLSPDDLLRISLGGLWPAVFSRYQGLIDSQGQTKAAIHIPNVQVLIGTRIHTAFVTLDKAAPSGIKAVSNTVLFSVSQ